MAMTLSGRQLELQNLGSGLLRAEASAYRQLRQDRTLTAPAVAAFALACFLAGLGSYMWAGIEYDWSSEFFWKSALLGSLFMFLFWGAALIAAFVVLRRWYPALLIDEVVRLGSLAAVPLALSFFVFIPDVGFGIGVLSAALALAVLVLALQLGFDLDPGRALLAGAPGFAVWAIVLPLLVSSDDPFGAGIFGMKWGLDALSAIVGALNRLSFG